MPKEIHLLLGDRGFYGQARKPWISLDTDLIVSSLEERGYKVTRHSLHKLVNADLPLERSIVLYSFSQIPNMRLYLKDLIWQLERKGNLVIPSWEYLLCHENKGYQEIIKKELGMDQPKGWYISNLEALSEYKLSYPLVLKGVEGSNSSAVSLVRDEDELRKGVKSLSGDFDWIKKLDLLRRRYLRGDRVFQGWPTEKAAREVDMYTKHIKPQKRFVLQEFVPGLDSDYRVIIFWDRYYVSRRMTRPGDWRASGTKLFTFSKEVDRALLDKAAALHQLLPSPILAADLGIKDGKTYLFEFQASHFGMNVVVRSSGYYSKVGDNWTFVEHKPSIEKEIGRAVDEFLLDQHADWLA